MSDEILEYNIQKFDQLLVLIRKVLSNDNEIDVIQKNLRRHFNTTSSTYLNSTDFRSLINQIHQSFVEQKPSTKYFKLLSQLDEQLKKYNTKRMNRMNNIPLNDVYHSEINTSSNDKMPVIRLNLLSTSEINDKSDNDNKRMKKIEKLERRLSNLSKIINELEKQDMSLDEMTHLNLYQTESNLKKQALDTYTRLQDLRNQPISIERILDQPITLIDDEIDHPLINQALQDMVNKTKFLPSFDDVIETVEQTNEKYELSLSVEAQKLVAERALKVIGIKVKDRRMADFNDIMNSRLPENFDITKNDPALKNHEIENILLKNQHEATIKTQKMFEVFSQIDVDIHSESSTQSTSEESTDDDDDDDNESESKDIDENPQDFQFDAVDVLPPFSPHRSENSKPIASVTTEDADECETICVVPRRRNWITTADISPVFDNASKRSLDTESSSMKSKKLKEHIETVTLD